MDNTTQYKDLPEFLAKHNAKSDKNDGANILSTHNRIPDKELNVFGGSYIIPREDLPQFYKLYGEHVFEKKKMEYLTERQLETNCPILLDFDFRYNYDVDTRQHTKEHVQDLINTVYLELLKEFFVFTNKCSFPIYVMEKPNVNRLADKSLTKDGIHIIIGVQMEHTLQTMLRDKVMEKISEIWDLPLINTWDSVLDVGITKGSVGWQLYGSRKPGFQAYELTQYYIITFDEADGEFMMEERSIDEIDVKKDIYKLSAQYSEHQQFDLNPKIVAEYDKIRSTNKPKKSNTKTKLKLLQNVDNEDDSNISIEDINSPEILKRAVDNMINNLTTQEYHIKETHEYTQILPAQFWEPGSHLNNRKVAFALKHTDERLFFSWIMLRSKAPDFDYGTIPELYNNWNKHFKNKPNGVTKRSIMYWAKQFANAEFIKVQKSTIRYFIELSLTSPTEYDFAMVLNQMFKDKYVCSNYMNKIWYVYKDHHWEKDMGNSLRLAISREMFTLYQSVLTETVSEMNQFDTNDKRYDDLNKRSKLISELSLKFKRTNDKTNIFKEAAEIFHDVEFVKKMDENKYLMCFTNGVIDFKNKIFRDGYPQDYITKCTNIPYVEIDKSFHKDTLTQITLFMEKLFPIESLNKYMWSHLASTLIGENINQTFNIYRGNGSNGKSLLIDLMKKTLGEYCGSVPVTLVTDKRVNLGSTSSEIMQLKGVRYAHMEEPSKDAQINEGMMKQLTGGDSLQARALYQESETFTPQFSLVVCTNTLFKIVSNDDGTWRRIRIVEFMSKFVAEIAANSETPYEYLQDPLLKDEKLPAWAPIFASMLINIAFESQGIVKDCDLVMSASKKYRQGQDHISGFVNEMVGKCEGKKINKRELCEQFKCWFQEQQGSKQVPKGIELCEYMDKKFGKCNDGWNNVEIIYSKTNNNSEIDNLNN